MVREIAHFAGEAAPDPLLIAGSVAGRLGRGDTCELEAGLPAYLLHINLVHFILAHPHSRRRLPYGAPALGWRSIHCPNTGESRASGEMSRLCPSCAGEPRSF